jgi:sulfite exporter TauE/SafE
LIAYFILLGATLIASSHCVLMCGPLMFSLVNSPQAQQQSQKSILYYHFGRLIGYLMMGALLGFLSSLIPASWRVFSAILFIFFLIMQFISTVYRDYAITKFFNHTFTLAFKKLFQFKIGPLVGGLGTCLLPCGLLATYLTLAISTYSTVKGALVLFILWLGTLPALHLSIRSLHFLNRTSSFLFINSKNKNYIFASFTLFLGILSLLLHAFAGNALEKSASHFFCF